MDITIRIGIDKASGYISAVPDDHTRRLEGVMVTTATMGDRLIFAPDDPATEVVIFFFAGVEKDKPSPVANPREPRVLQNSPSEVVGPFGRYRYSCVVNTLSGIRTYSALDGGGGEVDIPTGRR